MIKLWDDLPNAVEADGRFVYIKTDFRFWLLFDKLIKEEDTRFCDLNFVLENDDVMDDQIFEACLKFLYNENSTPTGGGTNQRLTDFNEDGEFIYYSFMEKYKIDLLDVQMHWHKFLALYRGLFNSYSEIVGYRAYDGKDKDMLKAKHSWTLPTKKDKSERKKQVLSILLGDGDFTKGGE